MGVWAIVPVKDASAAKTRLAAAITPADRRALQRTMLEHVLAELARCPSIERVVTVGPGCDWPELGEGVNATLRLARERVAGCALVVNADLPLLRAQEVESAIARAGTLLFASWDGEGTNGFLVPPGVPLLCSYGPDSLRRHQELYRGIGVDARPHRALGLSADIDTPTDLARYLLQALGAGDVEPGQGRGGSATPA